ncbi:MAG TPA: AAA family ATPase [Pyrinomonadaceae bacterium]|nr:AAA family ATPase [Chloracidobacterium sp.]MBL0239259.1 AAA family ATPase [Chloracidobacterium sp.]MBP9936014.1 AAA family ATPase [Pyrinomonadaceae bacterium]HQX55614.1 AAA family ATPase [Pyrinomonadaceae bacterium]HQY67633.1 AAA family ATPase [Pyrinomonadaceae bacterium]
MTISATLAANPTTEHSGVFVIKNANVWKDDPAARPKPVQLFEDFWFEGEMALLFGVSGKTTLAVQIAESIASGRIIETAVMTAEAQPVLYLDLCLSEKQFGLRYTADLEMETDVAPSDDYEFSPNFKRVEMTADTTIRTADDCDKFGQGIEWLVEKTGAKVLIIDNITAFRYSSGGTIGELMLLRELNRLKRDLGLSILVIVNNEIGNAGRALNVSDLGPSRILANFVDSVFAIGNSGNDGPFRYLKHLRARGTEVTFGGDHTPTFRLCKLDGNFLGFEFIDFFDEYTQLNGFGNGISKQNLREVFALRDENYTIRAIAEDLEISKSKVHRLLQMKRPAEPKPPPPPVEPEPVWRSTPEAYPGERTDAYLKSIGLKPTWKIEHEAKLAAEAAAREPTFDEFENDIGTKPESGSDPLPPVGTAGDIAAITSADPRFGLKTAIDGYGEKIYVEKEDERGKPVIWYKTERNRTYRRERTPTGILAETVDTS